MIGKELIYHKIKQPANQHHHHVVLLARISPSLSRHFFLSFIASGRSSGLHPVSSQSCCMYVRAGHPAFAPPYVGVHRSTSLMSSSLLLQQCPACLVRLAWIVGRNVFIPFLRTYAWSIWTRDTDSISYNNNHCVQLTSIKYGFIRPLC